MVLVLLPLDLLCVAALSDRSVDDLFRVAMKLLSEPSENYILSVVHAGATVGIDNREKNQKTVRKSNRCITICLKL